MLLSKLITTTDSLAIASTSLLGAAIDSPSAETIKVQVACFVVTKVLASIPSIIRAIKARRPARKAAK